MSNTSYASVIVHHEGRNPPPPPIPLKVPGRYLIGADPNAVVRLPAESGVASLHAILILEPTVLLVQDLASPGGTFLNERPIESTPLQDGDCIRCGSAPMRVQLVAQETSDAVSKINLPLQTERNSPPEIRGFTDLTWIGAGAVGNVYKARQLGSGRTVAIKCIRHELTDDERTRNLFVREASITSRLKHPRIVECIDFGFAHDHPYLVMEYIPSENLEAIAWRHDPVRRIRLSVKAVLRILEALAYAHDQGVVHRDVKPANVLARIVGGRLHLKLSDFSLAKIFDTAGYSGITASNEICGTLAYMSPEQLMDSRSARPDSDIYATVACLYRLLTAEYPYEEGTPIETIRRRLHEDARPVRTFNPAVPAELARIIDRGLSRSHDEHCTDAVVLHRALKQVKYS